jgi:peroxidase
MTTNAILGKTASRRAACRLGRKVFLMPARRVRALLLGAAAVAAAPMGSLANPPAPSSPGMEPPPHQSAPPMSPGALYPREFRSIDGSGNNRQNVLWGAAETELLRLAPNAYGDGSGTPSGSDRPSARAISNAVCAQSESLPNALGASDLFWQWGQFLDHDLDLTPVASPAEAFDIAVPTGDPWFDPFGTGTQTIPLSRSYYEMIGGVREQFNNITAFMDASNVYGSDADRAMELRTLDGTGKLKTSEGGFLPYNVNGFPNAGAGETFFLAGDFRANEQTGLLAMHTLFVREHNYWAERIARDPDLNGAPAPSGHVGPGTRPGSEFQLSRPPRPQLTDEQIYQRARAIVAAEMQVITYREFLPMLLGPNALAPYAGYKPNVYPGIANEFATAAYRFGHSMLSSEIARLDENNQPIAAGPLDLASAFFNPAALVETGIEPILRGLAHQRAQEFDQMVVDDVRNFLFGPPGSGGLDLASLNIQRGRDHGLPGYNAIRAAYLLPAATSFADISSDPDTQARLASVYANPDQVDLWVGGLCEDHLPGAMVGETFQAILKEQFEALRDGDRFWYRSYLPSHLVSLVESQSLAKIIRRNTDIGQELQPQALRVPGAGGNGGGPGGPGSGGNGGPGGGGNGDGPGGGGNGGGPGGGGGGNGGPHR